MNRNDNMTEAITLFRRTEAALKEVFEQSKSLQDASKRLSATEKSFVPVSDSVKSSASALESLGETIGALLPRLEDATEAFLLSTPEAALAAIDELKTEISGLEVLVNSWRLTVGSALEESSSRVDTLTKAVDELKAESSALGVSVDESRSTLGVALQQLTAQGEAQTTAVDALKTEIGVFSKLMDERLERWSADQGSRLKETESALETRIASGNESVQQDIARLAEGQSRLRLIAIGALVFAVVAAVGTVFGLI